MKGNQSAPLVLIHHVQQDHFEDADMIAAEEEYSYFFNSVIKSKEGFEENQPRHITLM